MRDVRARRQERRSALLQGLSTLGAEGGVERRPVLLLGNRDRDRVTRTLAAVARGADPRMHVVVAWDAPPTTPLDEQPGLRVSETLRGEGSDPIELLDLQPGEPLFLVEAGSLPPPGWCDALLAHRGSRGADHGDAWYAASTNTGTGASTIPVTLESLDGAGDVRERWWALQRRWSHDWSSVGEHVESADSPVHLIEDPLAHAGSLRAWWRGAHGASIALHHRARVVLVRDLVVWRDAPAGAGLRADVRDAVLPAGPLPARLDEVRSLQARLLGAVSAQRRPRVHLELAELFVRTAHFRQARQHAKAVLESWTHHVDAALALAEAEAQSGSEGMVRDRVHSLFHSTPLGARRRARALACLGESWRSTGDAAQAEQCFSSALDLDPGQPSALTGRGRLQLEAGEFDDALSSLGDATRLDPLRTSAWFHRARALAMVGELEQAREVLARTLAIHPGHRQARTLQSRLAGSGAHAVGA